ncbi:MAG: sigma-70 family RNA polymerase sigma factor [Verrucomicrobiota bacterium]
MERDAKHVLSEWLVLNARQGDERSFAELHELWHDDFRRLARMRLGNNDAVSEVCQDAWIAITKGLRRLDDPACFPRWAGLIVARKCIDWIRREQRRRGRETTWEAERDDRASDETALEEGDELVTLRQAIRRLDESSRELLQLFYETGFTIAEVATLMGVPEGTVKSRLHRLRQELKQHMERLKS